MKFPYVVKHNGVYYAIGEDVPIEEQASEVETAKVEEPKQVAPAVKEENILDKRKEFKLTKSDVNALKKAELQDLAREYGYDSTLGSAKLKALFIREFGL